MRNAPRPTAIDLFSGAGGLSLGLRDAGFSVLVGADWDPHSVHTHEANIGGLGYVGDLSEPAELISYLDGWGITDVDLVAGGPPCQPFSRAGRSMIRNLVASGSRSAEDPRAELWQGFMVVVSHLRPRAVLVENVPDLPSWDDGSVLMGFYESLKDLGYTVDARVLDGFQYGVPQHRARLFLVGLRDGRTFEWPEPRTDVTTLRDAIGDLPPVPPAQRAERIPYYGVPRSPFQRKMREGIPARDLTSIHDHITRDIRPDDAEAFALLGEGQTYMDLPMHLRRYRSDIFTDKYKRLVWDEVSRSITAHIAKDGYWYIHPQQHRTLSVREAARSDVPRLVPLRRPADERTTNIRYPASADFAITAVKLDVLPLCTWPRTSPRVRIESAHGGSRSPTILCAALLIESIDATGIDERNVPSRAGQKRSPGVGPVYQGADSASSSAIARGYRSARASLARSSTRSRPARTSCSSTPIAIRSAADCWGDLPILMPPMI